MAGGAGAKAAPDHCFFFFFFFFLLAANPRRKTLAMPISLLASFLKVLSDDITGSHER